MIAYYISETYELIILLEDRNMKNNRGYFVVIEGPDGAGKTTVANMLVDKLKSNDYDAIYCREPGGLIEGEKIRDIVLNHELSTEQRVLLFLASMSGNLEKIVKPALDDKKIVIMDRFVRSTYIYQGIINHDKNIVGEDYFDTMDVYNNDLRWQYRQRFMSDLIKYAFKGIFPDIEYVLQVQPEEAWKRTHSRSKAEDVFESKGYEYFKHINNGYWTPLVFPGVDEVVRIITDDKNAEEVTDVIYGNFIKLIEEDDKAYGDDE